MIKEWWGKPHPTIYLIEQRKNNKEIDKRQGGIRGFEQENS
jgi:hypothetical protein